MNANPQLELSFRDMPLTGGRIVVISPHLDDAIMSIGATIARAVRSGASVEVLTVYGYGPTSPASAGPWDAKSGFRTEQEACLERRREDAAACRILGATPRWLDFGAEPYERRGSPAEILAAVKTVLDGAACALLPGFPLTHPDHLELTQLLLGAQWPCPVGLYAEEPYVFYERKAFDPAMRAAGIESLVNGAPAWNHVRAEGADRRLKIRAVRCYRSQLRSLGLSHIGLYRMLWHESSQGGEAIAWVA